ncbi:MAG TPA: hypothetical protein VFD49_05800 [Candidatus Dormibacteraeota bacterium]|nr:hypothetical protein [Candidatus Dormibacteraeota bacterium]
MPLRPSPRARSANEAEKRYREVLQHALRCISQTVVWIAATPPRGGPGVRSLALSEEPIRLRAPSGELYLTATQEFTHRKEDGEWRCPTLAYIYSVFLDRELSREWLAWHWHPRVRPGPHLHVHARNDTPLEMHKLHLPTGRIAFEEVVRFLIQDVGVEPQAADWEERLKTSEYYFRAFRHWPGSSPEPTGRHDS